WHPCSGAPAHRSILTTPAAMVRRCTLERGRAPESAAGGTGGGGRPAKPVHVLDVRRYDGDEGVARADEHLVHHARIRAINVRKDATVTVARLDVELEQGGAADR